MYEIPKTPQPKEWVCLGSDLEILESKVTTSRPLVSEYTYYQQLKRVYYYLLHIHLQGVLVEGRVSLKNRLVFVVFT